MSRIYFKISVLMAMMLPVVQVLAAVKINDITHLDGARTNVIEGLGLVVGLNGTGDGGDFAATIRPMAEFLKTFGDPTDVRDLGKTQNVALVHLIAVIPANGAHKGDRIDVRISAAGAASKLTGGTLVRSPLNSPPFFGIAFASGRITIEDSASPNIGIITRGAQIEQEFSPPVINNGHIRLVLEEAAAKGNWATASMIAKTINGLAETTGETLAVAVDATTVDVTIPVGDRERPDGFISRVQQLEVNIVPTEARVLINEATGTVVITGDVEISPAVVIQGGLTITTTNPPLVPSPRNPITTERRTIGLDTTNTGGAKLKDLVDALDLIRVPVADRIAIIKSLHKSGKIHAKLYTDE